MIEGSFWRRLPAAALRGLTNSLAPAASACSFIRSKLATGRYTSPRTSSTGGRGFAFNVRGTAAMVATFAVTSSPTRPSPRVAAWTYRPSS